MGAKKDIWNDLVYKKKSMQLVVIEIGLKQYTDINGTSVMLL